jgi:hypothetical protein
MTSKGSEQVEALARPESVVWYERLALAAFAVGLVSAAANPAPLVKYYNQSPIGYPIIVVAFLTVQLLWIWLVARKRQNWARWIILIVTLIGIPIAIWEVEERFQINPVASIFFYLAFATSIVAVMLLFRADSREWFSRKRFASGV